jgi:cytochrome c peroxidase
MTELTLGSFVAIAVAALLLLGVTFELAPAGGLTGRGRWLLAAALGAGLLAFAVKLLTIVAFSLAPNGWVHQTLEPVKERSDVDGYRTGIEPARKIRWQGLPLVAPFPADNPTTPAKTELGRRLFHDKSLSLTGDVACASCHDLQGQAGADGRPTALGIHRQMGRRNTPTVWNAAFQTRLFWDGRAASLEEQALGPITNPLEMGMPDVDAAIRRLAADPDYREAFSRAFGANDQGEPVTAERLAAALAAFERTLITPDAPFDRFVRGDTSALTSLQIRGMTLFESTGCIHCHAGPNFSAASQFDGSAPFRAFPARPVAGLERLDLTEDLGRASPGSHQGVWRIPSLRNVAVTAPYFHNGSVNDLKEAVSIMARTQLGFSIGETPSINVIFDTQPNPGVFVQQAGNITDSDLDALTAFLEALTSPRFSNSAQSSHPGARP